MNEPIENILRAGYNTWRKNLILCVPLLTSGIMNIIILLAAIIVLTILLVSFIKSDMLFVSLLLTGLLITSVFFLMIFINSFFLAGAIGMSKEATENAKTSLSDMLTYGKKKTLSLFFVYIIVSLTVFLGFILFFIPAIAASLLNLTNIFLSLLIFGLSLCTLSGVILTIVLAPVSYAIVVCDLGAIEGIKEGYRFFMKNKLVVIFLLFTVEGISWGCGLIIQFITSLFGIIPFIGDLINLGIYLLYMIFVMAVIYPLSIVWWTRLYMGRTELKPKKKPTDAPLKDSAPEPETLNQEPIYI